jgi:hypothetical protein
MTGAEMARLGEVRRAHGRPLERPEAPASLPTASGACEGVPAVCAPSPWVEDDRRRCWRATRCIAVARDPGGRWALRSTKSRYTSGFFSAHGLEREGIDDQSVHSASVCEHRVA